MEPITSRETVTRRCDTSAIAGSRTDAVVLDRGGDQRDLGCSAKSMLSAAAASFTPTTIRSR
jgi:hypothetical protein